MTEINSEQLRQDFLRTRKLSAHLTLALSTEDHMLQSMPEASPTKWHLAHTTWFFETFLLKPRALSVQPDESFAVLFNSYYNGVGPQFRRAQRGLISRPGLHQVWSYRRALEDKMLERWNDFSAAEFHLIELGIQHEQQHQELIVTDIKHALFHHPQLPALVETPPSASTQAPEIRWHEFIEGDYWIGTEQGFCFDNEKPRHKIFLNGFRLANRPVTNAEYLEFMRDDGYGNFQHWLSEGWAWVNDSKARAPLYWQQLDGQWHNYTATGLRAVNPHEPVCHVNYYEASAFASWAGKRLPTEFEWEVAAASAARDGQFLDRDVLHPQPAHQKNLAGLLQMFGAVWEWTRSAYSPYPGFRASPNAVGEYNGKFMVNQWVLRGGSCATPEGHIRASYRNFFPVNASWQFSGVRLADDLD